MTTSLPAGTPATCDPLTIERPSTEIFLVEPERLDHGYWDQALDRSVGEGDISGSYSADRIAEGQPVRRPFVWQGKPWVCVGSWSHGGERQVEAYRLIDPQGFRGETTTYAEKTRDCEAARNDPKGFYHAMLVKGRGAAFVLSGPPAIFRAGEKAQGELF